MNCSFNNMTTLPDHILPRTEQLIMTGNNLENLDSVAENFPNVKKLDFNRSNIKTISGEAMKLFLLKSSMLYLSNNKLKIIPSLVQAKEYNTKVWLSENPFDCNCDMMWMRDWVQNTTNVMGKEDIVCASGKWEGIYN